MIKHKKSVIYHVGSGTYRWKLGRVNESTGDCVKLKNEFILLTNVMNTYNKSRIQSSIQRMKWNI